MDTDTDVWPGRDADPGGGAKDVCFGPALGPKASGTAATSPALCGPSCYPVRAPDDESAGRGRAGAVAQTGQVHDQWSVEAGQQLRGCRLEPWRAVDRPCGSSMATRGMW